MTSSRVPTLLTLSELNIVSQALERVRRAARQRKKERFTARLHHINIDLLRMAFFALKRDAAPGVDGLSWQTYEADLNRNLTDLHSRVHRGAYRALPSREAGTFCSSSSILTRLHPLASRATFSASTRSRSLARSVAAGDRSNHAKSVGGGPSCSFLACL
jgi:hypothetical protein